MKRVEQSLLTDAELSLSSRGRRQSHSRASLVWVMVIAAGLGYAVVGSFLAVRDPRRDITPAAVIDTVGYILMSGLIPSEEKP